MMLLTVKNHLMTISESKLRQSESKIVHSQRQCPNLPLTKKASMLLPQKAWKVIKLYTPIGSLFKSQPEIFFGSLYSECKQSYEYQFQSMKKPHRKNTSIYFLYHFIFNPFILIKQSYSFNLIINKIV